MTLLNTLMPADKAMRIIEGIFNSNRMVDIEIEDKSTNYYSRCTSFDDFLYKRQADDIVYSEEFTIVGINQITPTYSIGDKVLILSTGEIGELIGLGLDFNQRPAYIKDNQFFQVRVPHEKHRTNDIFLHWSEIAKLPNDL